MPGEPPLQLYTHQRRRDFAIPENLLVVAALLEYRADMLRALWDERLIAQADTLRHPLAAMIESLTRRFAEISGGGSPTSGRPACRQNEAATQLENSE